MEQVLFNGLTMGCIYALIASGFVLIYSSVGVVNFAQGDLVMVGSYLGVLGLTYWHIPMPLTLFMVVVGSGAVGYLFVHFVYLHLKNKGIVPVLITTIGAAIVLQNLIHVIAGPNPVPMDPFFTVAQFHVGAIGIPSQYLVIIGTAVLLLCIQFFIFRYTSLGRRLRATADDKYASRLVGINTKRMVIITFIISSVISGIAGFILVPLFFAQPTMGFPLIVKAWIGIVIGGFGSIPGAVIGGLLVGILDSLSSSYISSDYKDVITMTILLLVLFARPQGIFGEAAQEKL